MMGPPAPTEGNCNSKLCLGDDYGDNECTFLCNLPPKHEGLHSETSRGGRLIIQWDESEAESP